MAPVTPLVQKPAKQLVQAPCPTALLYVFFEQTSTRL